MNDVTYPPHLHAPVDSQPLLTAFAALLSDARRNRATDIHLEPVAGPAPLRYRVDGALRDVPPPAHLCAEQILPLVKTLCGLKPDHQTPKDGRGAISFGGQRIEFNAATFPTLNGERLTIHLSPEPIQSLSLDYLRLAPAETVQLQQLTDLPHGVVILAGPPGSGKTTLLYAMLLHMDRTGRSIMTIENPIEAPVPGVSQTAVQPGIGLTWRRCLNHILRQDPDVLAVAPPARHRAFPAIFSAAQQSRLMMLQLTTASGAHTLRHLLDSGLHPFQICDSLRAIVAQRTVRVLCPECKAPAHIDLETLPKEVAEFLSSMPLDSFFKPVGCARCRHTGHESILPMLEILLMDESLRDLMGTNPTLGALRDATSISSLTPLLHNALLKASVGLISLDEVRRVLPPGTL